MLPEKHHRSISNVRASTSCRLNRSIFVYGALRIKSRRNRIHGLASQLARERIPQLATLVRQCLEEIPVSFAIDMFNAHSITTFITTPIRGYDYPYYSLRFVPNAPRRHDQRIVIPP